MISTADHAKTTLMSVQKEMPGRGVAAVRKVGATSEYVQAGHQVPVGHEYEKIVFVDGLDGSSFKL